MRWDRGEGNLCLQPVCLHRLREPRVPRRISVPRHRDRVLPDRSSPDSRPDRNCASAKCRPLVPDTSSPVVDLPFEERVLRGRARSWLHAPASDLLSPLSKLAPPFTRLPSFSLRLRASETHLHTP